MKKVLLTSAAVLAVFASSAAVFANDGNVHTGNLDNKTEATGGDFFTNNEGGLTQAAKDGLNNVDADSTKQKFEDAGEHIEPKRDANGNIIKDEFVVTDKANANKDAKEEAKAVKAAERNRPQPAGPVPGVLFPSAIPGCACNRCQQSFTAKRCAGCL